MAGCSWRSSCEGHLLRAMVGNSFFECGLRRACMRRNEDWDLL